MDDVYAEGNLREYWIINLNNNTIEVYKNPIKGRYSEMKTYNSETDIQPIVTSNITFKLSDLL